MTRAKFQSSHFILHFFFSSDYLPKGFGIIQNGGSYSEYGRLKNRLTLLLLLTAAAVHIDTRTPGNGCCQGRMTSWQVYVDCIDCVSVYLCIFQRLAAGNGRGPLTGLNVAIIYFFVRGREREKATQGGERHVKHVPDIS